MRRLYIVFLLVFMVVTLLYSCEKERKPKDSSACVLQMKERFKDDLKCTEKHAMEVNLYMGLYKNEEVYFTMIMCPNCNTIAPAFGYTCENKKVDFDDFRNVKNVKEIYNSCTQKFME